jgi:hypothetical protein
MPGYDIYPLVKIAENVEQSEPGLYEMVRTRIALHPTCIGYDPPSGKVKNIHGICKSVDHMNRAS